LLLILWDRLKVPPTIVKHSNTQQQLVQIPMLLKNLNPTRNLRKDLTVRVSLQ